MNGASRAVSVLGDRGWTLGVAESLTGGALSAAVVSVPGASATLLGAVVAYATPVKHTLLGVDGELLAEFGAVHPEVARQMAAGVRAAVAVDGRPADVGVSTTGIAGPTSPDGQPVGTVHIGVVTPESTTVTSLILAGTREEIRRQTVDAAVDALLGAIGE
ncbi:CinA family protein [Microbacterium sp. XT11]|uniref:CinA family protein n=1 Tax=Microbacterium sp. XT11 TaxID=367477 RepID=UPI0007430548|nr:CinA family protein [Microbacterium sp. XT11]ALX66811.1 hypothetical protein AB663_002213 [Microbacterium sp. XT11]